VIETKNIAGLTKKNTSSPCMRQSLSGGKKSSGAFPGPLREAINGSFALSLEPDLFNSYFGQ
jgi:hypothetical protein